MVLTFSRLRAQTIEIKNRIGWSKSSLVIEADAIFGFNIWMGRFDCDMKKEV